MNSQILRDIKGCFDGIIGQSGPIARRVNAWASCALGGNPEGAFIRGAAGLGKTVLMRADARACALAMEIRGIPADPLFYQSAGELRRNGDEWKIFLGKALDSNSGPILCYLDEFHELFQGATIQGGKVRSIIKGLSDKQRGDVRTVSFGDEGHITRHASEVCFVVGTNFPTKIPDYEALASRLGVIDLQLYTPDELCAIAELLAKKAGLRVNEDTLAVMARCGRGTARPIEKMIDQAVQISLIEGKSTINRQDIAEIMRCLTIYPLGLQLHEVAMLVKGASGYVAKMTMQVILNIEAKIVGESLAYMEHAGLIAIVGGKFSTTKKGIDLIASMRAAKFKMPKE